jgi:DNA-binding NarL/FixJ family response regulator
VVVDDHELVRAGLMSLLDTAEDIEVVGAAADGQAAVALVSELAPDVVLMDLSMPVLDGIGATRRLNELTPTTRIVALTSFSDDDGVTRVLEAGAVGYLLKDCAPAALFEGVRAAAAGHAPLDPRVAHALLPGRAPSVLEQLSGREREVLRLAADGLANKQIARRLGIAESTVKVHLGRVFRHIGVTDRTSAALWAREHLGELG